MQIPAQQDFPIIREIQNERDRGAAIVGAGFLDSKLTEAIKACIRPDHDGAERLLKPTGPVGAFGNKALLGYMLKLYRKETLKDFRLIAQVRNRFAHIAEPITFGSDFVRERCEQLTLVKRVWSVIPEFSFSKRPFDAAAARKEYLEVISLRNELPPPPSATCKLPRARRRTSSFLSGNHTRTSQYGIC